MKRVKKVLLRLSSMPVLLYGMCVYASDNDVEYNDTGISVADARNTFTEGYEKAIKNSTNQAHYLLCNKIVSIFNKSRHNFKKKVVSLYENAFLKYF